MFRRFFGSIAALAVVVGACGGSGVHADSAGGPLASDWLDGDSDIEGEDLERVFALGARDAQVQAVFAEAKKRLGGGSVDALAERMKTCATDPAQEPGHAKLLCEHALLGLEVEDLVAGKPTAVTQQRIAEVVATPARDARVEMHTDYVLVERTLLPQICVVPRMTLAEAYEVLLHELVHALHYEPCKLMASATQPLDDDAFRQQVVLAPGGEADAYVLSVGARLRLGTPGSVTSPLLDLFDPQTGALRVTREALAPRILAPPPGGLGYAQNRLRDPRGEATAALIQQLSLRRSLLEELIRKRRSAAGVHAQNVAIHGQNIQASQHNIGVAQRKGDGRAQSEWRAKLAASEQGLAATKASLDAASASETRLTAELATLDAQLAELRGGAGGAVGSGSPAR